MFPRLAYNSYRELQPERIFIIAVAAKKPLLQGHPSSPTEPLAFRGHSISLFLSPNPMHIFAGLHPDQGKIQGLCAITNWSRAMEETERDRKHVRSSSIVQFRCQVFLHGVARKGGPQG
jgi:hypothetical protein